MDPLIFGAHRRTRYRDSDTKDAKARRETHIARWNETREVLYMVTRWEEWLRVFAIYGYWQQWLLYNADSYRAAKPSLFPDNEKDGGSA